MKKSHFSAAVHFQKATGIDPAASRFFIKMFTWPIVVDHQKLIAIFFLITAGTAFTADSFPIAVQLHISAQGGIVS
jgi:hypothetical protein